MKVLKYSTIALLAVLSLSMSSVSAGRHLTMSDVYMPGSGSDIGHIEGPLEKDTVSSQYLKNNTGSSVQARVYGKGMDGTVGWDPTWQTARGDQAWTALGHYNDVFNNMNQYGIYPASVNALGVKNTSSSARSFGGTWITDKDLYDAFINM